MKRGIDITFYEWRLTAWVMSETRIRLDATGRGIYRELLDHCYGQGGFPNDLDWICRTCACTREEYESVWPKIQKHFTLARQKNVFFNKIASIFRKKIHLYVKTQTDRRISAIRKAKEINDIHKVAPSKPQASSGIPRALSKLTELTELTEQAEASDSLTENVLRETAKRMYAAHPKKKKLALVLEALRRATKLTALVDIELCHAAWCKTNDWIKQSGRFVSPLDEWLDDQGFTQRPPGAQVTVAKFRPYVEPVKPWEEGDDELPVKNGAAHG